MAPPSASDPFFAAARPAPVQTSAGPCDLPILYTAASLLAVAYRVDPARARACMAGLPFEPWLVLGKAVALVAAFDYRETTIGPYGELAVVILSRQIGASPSLLRFARDMRDERQAGMWVTNLPVTTERARAAGVELWGFPKYVSPMALDLREERCRVQLGDEFELTLGPARGPTTRCIPIVTLSVRGGHPHRTVVETDNPVRWGGAGSARLQVRGDGPTARTLEALDLPRLTATASFRTTGLRALLPLGEDLDRAPAVGS